VRGRTSGVVREGMTGIDPNSTELLDSE